MAISDEAVLQYSGALGHIFVVVRGKSGDRSCGLETMRLGEAREYVAKEAGPGTPVIYRKTANGWKRTA